MRANHSKQESMPFALWSLALAAFGVGTTELVPMGVLPIIADDLHVSIFAAGLLITGYALGVVIGVPLISVLTSRISRKTLLLGMLAAFVIGNLLCAVAPNYPILLLARVVISFMHGTFFGESYVLAAKMVPAHKQTQALALVASGLTLSTIMGAPLGSFLGVAYGWRTPFYLIAGIGVIAFFAMAWLLPKTPKEEVASLQKQASVLKRKQVILALLMTVFGFGGVFTALTYISPMLKELTGFVDQDVTRILLLYGAGSLIGNILGAKLADRQLMPTLLGALFALSLILAALSWTLRDPITAFISTFLWGIAAFASVSPLQMRILELATDAPHFASGLNVAAFNLGNALGAFLGGLVVDSTSVSIAYLPWVAAAMTGLGVLFTIISLDLDKKSKGIKASSFPIRATSKTEGV